ncbi:MAG: hypothetical protein ABSH16_12505 [Sedimentisphaerales bacterium]
MDDYTCYCAIIENAMENCEKILKMILKTVVILMMVCLLCSCEEIGTASPEDYIGPGIKPSEPNATSQQGAKKTGVPPVEPSAIVAIEPNGPLNITLNEAVIISLEKNKSLVVQKLNPQISRTVEQQALSAFDPDLTASISAGKTRQKTVPAPGAGSVDETTRIYSAEAALSEFLPTGTTIALRGSTEKLDNSLVAEQFAAR